MSLGREIDPRILDPAALPRPRFGPNVHVARRNHDHVYLEYTERGGSPELHEISRMLDGTILARRIPVEHSGPRFADSIIGGADRSLRILRERRLKEPGMITALENLIPSSLGHSFLDYLISCDDRSRGSG